MTRVVNVTWIDGESAEYDLDTDDLDSFLDDFYNLEEGEEVVIKVLEVREDWE